MRVAERIGDTDMLGQALTRHGNELRKAGHVKAAVVRLQHAATVAAVADARGAALILLARAAGELGATPAFDEALRNHRPLLERHAGESMLFNPFTTREVELRGLLATGRTDLAVRLATVGPPPVSGPVAPQWAVIERVTVGAVLVSARLSRATDPPGPTGRPPVDLLGCRGIRST
ncbi:hypothetical protein [Actinoalloteichus fjordicus]|uniref:hypothetical protein n=1 Tax=Actinoalloteichus fjordicus TaxID=1612552 RepID=UPI0018DE7C1D|nr:hypothetical protein [Actinoalloteichus fjordicus]